jgi:hypothetical protein
METYRIKSQFVPIFMGLHGLHITPSEAWDYVNVHVFDHQVLSNLGPHNRFTSLPRNCDSGLIHTVLEQTQHNKTTPKQIRKLKEYLQLAIQKDKNDEIKSDLKEAIKQVFLGLLIIVVGGSSGFALMILLMGLSPASASWLSFLFIPIVAVAVYGAMKLGVGCLKFGIGVFSLCFRQKNTEQLPMLENTLRCLCFQPIPPPPSYQEVMENNSIFPSAPIYSEEPPTYQQALNSAALSAHTAHTLSAVCVPVLVSWSGGDSAHFFQPPQVLCAATQSLDNGVHYRPWSPL